MSDDASVADTDAHTSDDAPADATTATSAQSVRTPADAQTVVVCCDGSAAGGTPARPGPPQSAAGHADGADGDIEGEDDDTTSTQMRHWLTNDLLAGFLHLTLVAVVLAAGLGHLDLAAIPPRMRLVFLGTVLSATVWSFGEDVLQSIRGS